MQRKKKRKKKTMEIQAGLQDVRARTDLHVQQSQRVNDLNLVRQTFFSLPEW